MPATFDAIGQIEAEVGWEDATTRSTSPLRTFIQRPWRLFLAFSRQRYNRSYPWGEVLIDISPTESTVEGHGALPAPLSGEVSVDIAPTEFTIEGYGAFSTFSGIGRMKPIRRWALFYPMRAGAFTPLGGTVRMEVGTLVSAIETDMEPDGQAISASIASGSKTYVT